MRFRPTDDPAEPNDGYAEATPLRPGQEMSANILPRGDSDHYAIGVAHGGSLTVRFMESPANLDIYFRVLDSEGRQVHGWQGAPTEGELFAADADVPRPGDYIIEVRDGNSNQRRPTIQLRRDKQLTTQDSVSTVMHSLRCVGREA